MGVDRGVSGLDSDQSKCGMAEHLTFFAQEKEKLRYHRPVPSNAQHDDGGGQVEATGMPGLGTAGKTLQRGGSCVG